MANLKLVEYLWIDGATPVRQIRSKARTVALTETVTIDDFPQWSFDGSSTAQSEGANSDLLLQPVNMVMDPLRKGSYLVLCEVLNQDGAPHPTNKRAGLRQLLESGADAAEAWIGFEQEYTLFSGARPLGWPEIGYPAPQGPYYCGAGANNVFGRDLVEAHAQACLEAGVMFYGLNAEVMPGQWEFQVGYRGLDHENADVLNISDHLWIARWLLHRLGENAGITVSFDNKPVEGDWNGAGCHTNFSTKAMREEGGLDAINDAIDLMSDVHDAHIEVYGHGLDRRLTGLHETCHIGEFKAGVTDRGCSIRIPAQVQESGKGYFEDRRPGANIDPYEVGARLLKTVLQMEDATMEAALV